MMDSHTRCVTLALVTLIVSGCQSDLDDPQLATTSGALGTLTNQIGRRTSTGNSQKRAVFNYDAAGRIKETQHAMEGVAYLYTERYGYPKRTLGPSDTELGTVPQSSQLPDGEVISYEYDRTGNQQKVKAGNDVIVASIRRNARGQPTSIMHGNNVETEHRYNDQGDMRLRDIVSRHRPPGGTVRVVQAYEYTFDGAGNVREIRDYCNAANDVCPCDPTAASCVSGTLSRAFDYDEMDRLLKARAPEGMTIPGLPRSYGYDAIDNLTSKDGIAQTYGANGKPHALASANGATYSYDANGNLTSTTAGLTMTWNAQNMPALEIKSGQRVRKQFLGDAVWKKIEGSTTTLYLPSVRIENGKHRKYYGAYAERDPDAGGALRFYHGDHLGSATLVTDASGAIVHRAAYLPYGEDDPSFTRSNVFAPKYRFNFKERETTTGLYDYGVRMYDPTTGRWISPDGSDADGLNRYAYVKNNPVRYRDPDGRASDDPQVVWTTIYVAGETWVVPVPAGLSLDSIPQPGDPYVPGKIPLQYQHAADALSEFIDFRSGLRGFAADLFSAGIAPYLSAKKLQSEFPGAFQYHEFSEMGIGIAGIRRLLPYAEKQVPKLVEKALVSLGYKANKLVLATAESMIEHIQSGGALLEGWKYIAQKGGTRLLEAVAQDGTRVFASVRDVGGATVTRILGVTKAHVDPGDFKKVSDEAYHQFITVIKERFEAMER